MPINSYKDLQNFLNSVLTANGQLADCKSGACPHRDFWNNLSYNDFVNGPIPNVKDPTTNPPSAMPILVKGDSQHSNIILALSGAPGTLFDPNNPSPNAFGQMPADGPPFFSAAQIAEIAAWIDAGCPQ